MTDDPLRAAIREAIQVWVREAETTDGLHMWSELSDHIALAVQPLLSCTLGRG